MTEATTHSPYARAGQDTSDVLRPRTDLAVEQAPQSGVHLYHFPLSLCSQKVRQALAEKRVAWDSHVVLLPLGEQFDPNYVRINPRCVVPSLVRDGRVTTDSENIVRLIDAQFEGPRLVPEDPGERACVDRFIALADGLFVEVLTYGEIAGIRKPWILRRASKGSHTHRLARIDALIREHADDPFLREAYETKRGFVEATRATIATELGMTAVLDVTEASIAELETQLEDGPFSADGWLCSPEFSLADLEWGIVLNRLRWVGLGPRMWGARRRVGRYAAQLFARPSFAAGVLAWDHPFTQIMLPMLGKRIHGRS